MESYLYEEMFRLEERHWWFAAKHQIILTLLARLVKPGGRIADIGCGCGRMLQLLSDQYDAVGIDASPLAAEFSRQRGVRVVEGSLPGNLPLPAGSFDAAMMLDVLEHLDDDVASARSAAALLKPEGILLVTVPAYQWLYGPHDAAHHHRRRYSRSTLEKAITSAGLRLKYISYYNTFLFPLAVAQRMMQRRVAPGKPVSTAPPAAPVNALFRSIFASERHLLGRASLPVGLSLVAVAGRA
jgi:SAM-dependent methyltransferase